jgi:hypothetical protein
MPAVDLAGWIASLTWFAAEAVDDAERIDRLRRLEELKGAAAAAQARLTVCFADSQRHAQQQAGVRAKDVGKGIAAQVGLARRDSPVKGARHLGLAQALVFELPHTMTALSRGLVSEWRAQLMVRETACLSREDRIRVDAELAARPGGLEALGDAALVTEARRIAYRLDPYAFTERARKATAERCVTLRPAPDTMTYLTALLPVAQGVAAYAALTRHADTARAGGEPRSRGQVMADTLVERLTGQAAASDVPVEVDLVMTDRSLFANPDQPGGQEPAEVLGYGPVPAPLARQWITQTADTDTDTDTGTGTGTDTDTGTDTGVWIRRLFTSPDGTRLVDLDTRRREFPAKLRRFIDLRDRRCRTPWCDAPIRHRDHPLRVADGGQSSEPNSQGLCEACNYTKEATGWRARGRPDGAVVTTTPTGHTYTSHPPPPIGSRASLPDDAGVTSGDPATAASPLEAHLRDLLRSA